MAKYRKKPVVIDAWKFEAALDNPKPAWLIRAFSRSDVAYAGVSNTELAIKTLEGTMTASYGDFIILGVKGEIYPCKSDIFEATYEAAE